MKSRPTYRGRPIAALAVLIVLLLGADLSNETLAGVKVGDNPDKVEQILGKAEMYGKIGHSPEAGGEIWVMGYKSKDLRVWVLLPDQDKVPRVMGVSALGKSTAKTAKGIAIGATREQAEKAYGPLTKLSDETSIVPGQAGNALAFTFKEDRVIRIVLGKIPGFQ